MSPRAMRHKSLRIQSSAPTDAPRPGRLWPRPHGPVKTRFCAVPHVSSPLTSALLSAERRARRLLRLRERKPRRRSITCSQRTTRSTADGAPLRVGAEVRRLPRAAPRSFLTGSAGVVVVGPDTLALSPGRKCADPGACNLAASDQLEAEAAPINLGAPQGTTTSGLVDVVRLPAPSVDSAAFARDPRPSRIERGPRSADFRVLGAKQKSGGPHESAGDSSNWH
jgi:hypothetical protein